MTTTLKASYKGSITTWDAPDDIDNLKFYVHAGGGGEGGSYDGGNGGRIDVEVDHLKYDSFTLYVGGGGEEHNTYGMADGGWGYQNGEDGTHFGGAGAGSSAVISNGNLLAAAGGGGGGGEGALDGDSGDGGGPGGGAAPNGDGSGTAGDVESWVLKEGDGGAGGGGAGDDDGEDGAIYIEYDTIDPGYFDVSFVGQTPASPTDKDDINYDINITNTGDKDHRDRVYLRANGTAVDSTTLSLAAGASATRTLTWATSDSGHSAGTHDMRVTVDNTGGADSTSTTIAESAYHGISINGDTVGRVALNGDKISHIYRNDDDGTGEHLVWED